VENTRYVRVFHSRQWYNCNIGYLLFAHAVCPHSLRAICSACVNFFLSFLNKPLRQIISGSTRPIFTKFSPNGTYFVVVDDLTLFFDSSRDVTMSINFRVKIGLHLSLSYFETACNIAIPISKGSFAMIWLHRVKIL